MKTDFKNRIKEDKIMAMEITNNYSSYAAQTMTESGATSGTKKKGTEKTQETANPRVQQSMQTNWRNLPQA